LELGLGFTVQALERIGTAPRDLGRCRSLFDAGQLSFFMGRYAKAQRYLEESLAIAREINDQRRIAVVLQPLGMAYFGQGDAANARRCLEEGVALAETLGEPREIAGALNALGQLHRAEGELEKADPLYHRMLALARELDDRETIAIGLLNLSMVAIARSHAKEAGTLLRDVVTIADELASRRLAQSVWEVATGLAALDHEWPQVARFYRFAEALAAETGLHRDPADEAFITTYVTQARAALGAEEFATAEAAARGSPYEQAMDETRSWLASRVG
jgi:tetratricopeptide (TPR) repeat protein